MRFTSSKGMLVALALILIGLGTAIACQAVTNPETMVPPAVAAPPPTPTELPAAEKQVAERAKQYLREHAAEYSLRSDLSDLQVSRVDMSMGTSAVGFRQLYRGIPVDGTGVTVYIFSDPKQPIEVSSSYNPHIVLKATTPAYPGPDGNGPSLTPKLSADDGLSRALTAVNVKGQLMKPATPELVLYPVGRAGAYMQYALAWRMTLNALNPPGDWDVVIDALSGEVLRTYNMRTSYLRNQSRSTASAPNSKMSAAPSPTSPPRVAQGTPVRKANPTPSKVPESVIAGRPLRPSGTAAAKRTPPKPSRPLVAQRSNALVALPDHKILSGKRTSNRAGMQASVATTAGWNTIMTEGFEGVWPAGSWWVSDSPTWDDESYRSNSGSWSAWCAGSSRTPPSDQYPNDMNAWTTYGPFDLSDATAADLQFYYWLKSEANHDFLAWYASIDDYNYYGYYVSGDSGGWQFESFDLTNVPTLGDVTGRPNVWVAFVFASDGSVTEEGAYVDDILVEKYVPPIPPNLTAYTPGGWDYPLVPSSVQGTHSVNTLYALGNTYVDWALVNDGSLTAYNFYVDVYLDNSLIGRWSIGELSPGTYVYVEDWLMPAPSSGSHTLKLIADPTGAVGESSESDNTWERSFNWIARVGWVFNPNPVVTSGDTTLRDNNNQDSPTLTNQRVQVTLQGLDGSGYLRGPYVDLTAPGMTGAGTRCDAGQPNGSGKPAGLAFEPTLVFNYTRSNDRFEEVMAYYHIDSMQRYIQSLGFTNVVNRSIAVHAHCYSSDDSFYSTGDNGIGFGDGGVDSAEDGEVIAHEYGHAIQFSQVPLWGAQLEGQAMGEGFGNYWAASYFASQNPTTFFKTCFAEWDYSDSLPACGWIINSSKHYPEDIVNNLHLDGQIWSAVLWELWNAVGRDPSNRIVVQSHFLLADPSRDARFGEGADAIARADRDLNGGANASTIADIFRRRGIFDAYEMDNSAATATWISTDNSAQRHRFHSVSDVDWVKFTAIAGYQYTVNTRNLETTNTVLELYGTDGSTLLASNDDCGPYNGSSCITWTAPSTGTYYVRARPFDGTWTGRSANYDLGVWSNVLMNYRLYLPLITK